MKIRENENGYSASERQYLLYRFFLEHSNREQVVEPKQIEDFLASYGIKISTNSLYNDIRRLRMAETYNLQIEFDYKKHGYFVKNPPFEPREIRLLVNSIQASKFLTAASAEKLVRKVKGLTDKYTAATLNRPAVVSGRIRSMNESVVNEVDRIYQAIEDDRQIKFRYFHFTPDRNAEKSYSKGGQWLTVSPFALYWNNGNLYLYAYDGKQFRFYRVDRMENIGKPLDVKREGKEQYSEKDLTASRSKIFDMFSGEEHDVKMRFHNRIAHSVIDQFGKDVLMIPDGKDHFTIWQRVQVSPPFFAWIATFGRSAKIVEPPEVVKQMRDFLQKSMDMYKDDGNT